MSLESEGDSKPTPEGDKWLMEEYKLLQSKIDKFGEDRFKVRSWCVTLVSGLILGAKLTSSGMLLILNLALMAVVLFHLLEHQLRDFSRQLGKRAREIERALQKGLSPQLRRELRYVPGVAHALFEHAKNEKDVGFPKLWEREGTGSAKLTKWLPIKLSMGGFNQLWRWTVSRAENAFYVGQYIVLAIAILSTVFAGKAISDSDSRLTLNASNSFHFTFPATNFTTSNYVITNVTVINQAPTNAAR